VKRSFSRVPYAPSGSNRRRGGGGGGGGGGRRIIIQAVGSTPWAGISPPTQDNTNTE
jgi:hypothetical protein